MYKLTIERVDPAVQVVAQLVYLTEVEGKLVSALGVKVEKREAGQTYRDRDIEERPLLARIPVLDTSRVVEKRVYEQIVEELDLAAVIKAVNKL